MKSISSAAIILFKKFISMFLIRYVKKFYVRHDTTVLLVVVSIKYPFQYVKFDFHLFLLPVSMLKKDQSHYFSQIDEKMKDALQGDCTRCVPGIEIINGRVMKPTIPKSIRNFKQMEEERTKVCYALGQIHSFTFPPLKPGLRQKKRKKKMILLVNNNAF